MSTEQQTFTLNGHRYEVLLHPPMEGFIILQGLAGLGLEPIAQVVEGALPPLVKVAQDTATQLQVLQIAAKQDARDGREPRNATLLDVDLDLGGVLKEVLGGLQLAEVGAKMARAFRDLDPSMVARLLAYTNRDGKPMVSGGETTLDFNAAYRGNYAELMLALVEVARRNGFFGGWATSGGAETLWAKAKESYQRARAASSSVPPAEA